MAGHSAIQTIDETIQVLLEKRQELDVDIEKLRDARGVLQVHIPVDADQPAKKDTKPNHSFTNMVTDTIEELLLEKRPLHRKILFEKVEARGFAIGGKDPLNRFGVYMSNDPRFRPDPYLRGNWTLTNEPDK